MLNQTEHESILMIYGMGDFPIRLNSDEILCPNRIALETFFASRHINKFPDTIIITSASEYTIECFRSVFWGIRNLHGNKPGPKVISVRDYFPDGLVFPSTSNSNLRKSWPTEGFSRINKVCTNLNNFFTKDWPTPQIQIP